MSVQSWDWRRKQDVVLRQEHKAGEKLFVDLALIGRPKGATLAEITKAVGWQAHSVRGYLSNATKPRLKLSG